MARCCTRERNCIPQKTSGNSTEYDWHTRELPPLPNGTFVLIQGKDKKWKKQGKVIEVLDHHQYRVCLFGSGRTTLRNCRFLHECVQIEPMPTITSMPEIQNPTDQPAQPTERQEPGTPQIVEQSNEAAIPPVNLAEPLPQELNSSEQSITQSPLPRALRNLQDFNIPGLKE